MYKWSILTDSKIQHKKDFRDLRMVNSYPRKILNGKSAKEVVKEELKRCA
jgi:IS30 family transposase